MKQTPQDILNEILLRMNYDSSKTLSENKELIFEQGGLSAQRIMPTPQQFRQRFIPTTVEKLPGKPLYYNTKTGKIATLFDNKNDIIPVETVYPEITNNIYPANADINKINTVLSTSKNKTSSVDFTNRPKNENETKIFQDWLDFYYPTWYKGGKLNKGVGYGTFGPRTTSAWNTYKTKWSEFGGGLMLGYNNILKKYGVTSEKNNDLPGEVQNEMLSEISKFGQKFKNHFGENLYTQYFAGLSKTYKKPSISPLPKIDPQYRDATSRNKPIGLNTDLGLAITKTKKIKINGTNDFEIEIPENATVYSFDLFGNDTKSLDNFKKSVVFKGEYAVWNTWQTILPTLNLTNFVKGFSFEYRGKTLDFKRAVNSESLLNEFCIQTQNGYLKYNIQDYKTLSSWEEWGPTLLNLASISVAVLGPATWPLLLVSAGMDLAAAEMQYKQGDNEGAKLSALLAFTPFLGKFAIKVPKAAADNLAQKFVNAKTKTEIDNIVATLSKEELNTLKSLQELGDISKIQKMVSDPEVKKAIVNSAKKVESLATTSLKKGLFELGITGGLLYSQWENLKKESLSEMTRKELLIQTIKIVSDMTEAKEDKEKFDDLSKSVGEMATAQIINKLEELINDAKQKENKKLKEADNDINNVLDFLKQPIPLDNKIGSDSTNIINNINNIGEIGLK